MNGLHHQKCFHHEAREAIVMCTGCRRFFCSECHSVIEGKATCNACLETKKGTRRQISFQWVAYPIAIASLALSLVIVFVFFLSAGGILARMSESSQSLINTLTGNGMQ